MKEVEIARVNWVICPKCQYRYHLGPQLLRAEGAPSICPKCRLEFDPKPHLEPKYDELTAADLI
jgi:hypothetical protein